MTHQFSTDYYYFKIYPFLKKISLLIMGKELYVHMIG